jgi:hypothetical protein
VSEYLSLLQRCRMASKNIFRAITPIQAPALALNHKIFPQLSFSKFQSVFIANNNSSQQSRFAPHAKQPYINSRAQYSTIQDFRRSKSELLEAIEKEKDSLLVRQEEEEEFLSSNHFELEILEDRNRRIKRNIHGYSVVVEFEVPEQLDLTQIDEDQEEKEADTDEAESDIKSVVKLDVTVKKGGASDLQSQCVIGADRRFYIETIKTSDGPNPVWTLDLSTEFHERLCDFFDNLGLDDRFAGFIILLTENEHATNAINQLESLHKFLK